MTLTGVPAGRHQPGRQLLTGLVEAVVDAGHEHVEAVQELVVVVERPVAADAQLGPVQQGDVAQAGSSRARMQLALGQQLVAAGPGRAPAARRGR